MQLSKILSIYWSQVHLPTFTLCSCLVKSIFFQCNFRRSYRYIGVRSIFLLSRYAHVWLNPSSFNATFEDPIDILELGPSSYFHAMLMFSQIHLHSMQLSKILSIYWSQVHLPTFTLCSCLVKSIFFQCNFRRSYRYIGVRSIFLLSRYAHVWLNPSSFNATFEDPIDILELGPSSYFHAMLMFG